MAADSVSYDAITKNFDSPAYKLLEKIGEGGFGCVYKATQINTGQAVAIKFLVMDPEFDEPKKKRYIERFERETLLCSRLEHPNIVRLLDKGRGKNDLLYAVFEYVDGKSLKEALIESGALPAVETAEIMGQVLEALVHAHEQGVIHRDIKPANIMLQQTGVKTYAKVLDFGIGTLVNEARQHDYRTLTLTQETLGTPSYSSPEQLRGEAPSVKTDIYVWALVFLECLTGEPAVSGPSVAAIFHKQLSQTNVPLPAPIVGHPVAALLRRALQKKSHERTITGPELFSELKKLNFSNLVGNLSSRGVGGLADTTTCAVTTEQDTMVNSNAHAMTSLVERKQITALAVCLQVRKVTDGIIDSEVVEALHHDQKNQCVDIAVRYSATHVGTLGDTLLFYFGYPAVSDNDARLCARTALDIIGSLAKRNAQLSSGQGIVMRARLGIHTGLVTTYADSTPEGETPNTALELCRQAGENQILCSDIVRKLLEAYIQFDPASVIEVGVNAEQIPTFKLTGERLVEAFGFLRGKQRNECFIGREQELDTLSRILDHQNHEEESSRLAHVYGEAGIGKSRLVFELRNKAKGYYHYVAQCLPEHQNNALYPILNLLKFKYSLDALDNDQTTALLIDLAELLDNEHASVVTQALPVLLTWLNIPLPEGMEPSTFAPDVQKQYLFNALSALFMNSEGHDAKKLYIFEDMHWADPTSIEFIAQFANNIQASDDVFISTSRQPLPQLLADKGFKSVEINRLDAESTKDFISALFDKEVIGKDVLKLLIDRTDGIPLFIEELVKMLQQKELVHRLNGMIVFISPDKLDEVPTSLRDSLQQKLDSLVSAKETAQLAATIGREFDYDLLVAASNHTESQVQNDLNELVEAELVYQQRKVDGDSYLFKHALVRDAAYESIGGLSLKSSHNRLADAIISNFPHIIEEQPLELARHLGEGERYSEAADFGFKSIENLVWSFSYNEALIAREIVDKWIERIGCESDEYRRKLSLYELLLPAALAVEGFSSDKASDWSEEIKGSKLFDSSEIYPALDKVQVKIEWIKLANLHYSSQREVAREFGESLLDRYSGEEFSEFRMLVLSVLGQIYQFSGELEKSILSFETSLSIYDQNTSHHVSLEYGYDFYPTTLAFLSLSYIHVGRLDESVEALGSSIRYAESKKSSISIMISLNFKALFYSMLKKDSIVLEVANYYNNNHYNEMEPIFYKIYMDIMSAAAAGDVVKARDHIVFLVNSVQNFATGWYFHLIARKMLLLNDADGAIEMMEMSMTEAKKSQEYAVFPIIQHALAMSYYKKDGFVSSRVKDNLLEAIETAQSQGANYLEYESRIFLSEIDLAIEVCENEKRLDELRGFLIDHSNSLSDLKGSFD
ncbi:TOMM system kinase/cyclase fusion protein [Oceanospirillum beijerinckii]|uniref:TOMM system kinase/cyclase fusion protein n=1 Tax=Oceanospirillum beijerinckii TaxID=64976 RepID=UPI00041F47CB|nr:TOMM system kinase/cyclase fusion protein [Oceanospirillum beijerinckii]